MTGSLVFDPLIPWPVIWALGGGLVAMIALAVWRNLAGWALRGAAGIVILAALSQPAFQQENRDALDDIVLLVTDLSDSQQLAGRDARAQEAADTLAARIETRTNTRVRRITLDNGPDNTGTLAMGALTQALAEEPRARVAGILMITDGQVHDVDQAPDLPAPMHILLTGQSQDWDRRLIVQNAPAFAILGEEITLTLRIEDQGAAPAEARTSPLEIAIDGEAPQTFTLPIGEDVTLPVMLPHGGRNVIQFSVPAQDGELTDRNNTALVQINGVRDRLRVLLVSGEPHAGSRTWRNLLKSDSSVDLVHFTILRPPEKQDGVPVSELSLIAFPTRELFLDKIEDFDLIIFDRYKRRGILPTIYLDNVTNYISEGGAVLIAAGPDFASADSLYRSPLAPVLPGEPTARVIERAFLPKITELGQRHPVTAGLELTGAQGDAPWGRWLRQVEVTERAGQTVMSGHEDAPLLILDRVGEGRVALLASDQAWLWNRGYEGGGPQLELLRRLAHWMMKEPELEEEALTAEATGQSMRIFRRTLNDAVGPVQITTPDGEVVELPMTETRPGLFETLFEGDDVGLYRLTEGEQNAVIGLGPAAPREFEKTVATGDILDPVVATRRGGILSLENGLPRIRNVREGRPAAGRGWIGLTPRNAFETLSITQAPLLPGWLVLLLTSGLILAGWMREGRR